MHLVLFLSLDNLQYYGDIPEIPENNMKQVVLFKLYPSDGELFRDDVMDIDEKCNAILDCGDVEYFDFNQCKKLIAWIDERLQEPAVPRYREILEVLKKYCQRAIELNTGVVIEL